MIEVDRREAEAILSTLRYMLEVGGEGPIVSFEPDGVSLELVGPTGLEPASRWLKASRSTI